MDLYKLGDIAIEAAISAGKVIQKHLDNDVLIENKLAGSSYASQVVTEVDRACESMILSLLQNSSEQFNIAILSEETKDDGSRFEKDFFWCIDPMDGTLPFVNKRPGFSVSIALVDRHGVPFIGVVYDPCTETLYHAIKGKGAFKNSVPWIAQRQNKFLSYFTDRELKDTPRVAEIESILQEKRELLHLQGMREISGSGSVMNAIFVAENGPACMLKFPKEEEGGGSVWDFAATACLFNELGLQATNFEGERLDLNRREGTFMNHGGVLYENM